MIIIIIILLIKKIQFNFFVSNQGFKYFNLEYWSNMNNWIFVVYEDNRNLLSNFISYFIYGNIRVFIYTIITHDMTPLFLGSIFWTGLTRVSLWISCHAHSSLYFEIDILSGFQTYWKYISLWVIRQASWSPPASSLDAYELFLVWSSRSVE